MSKALVQLVKKAELADSEPSEREALRFLADVSDDDDAVLLPLSEFRDAAKRGLNGWKVILDCFALAKKDYLCIMHPGDYMDYRVYLLNPKLAELAKAAIPAKAAEPTKAGKPAKSSKAVKPTKGAKAATVKQPAVKKPKKMIKLQPIDYEKFPTPKDGLKSKVVYESERQVGG